MNRPLSHCSARFHRIARVSWPAAAVGALSVLLVSEGVGGMLDAVAPSACARLALVLIVLLPLAGAAAFVPPLRRHATRWVGPLSCQARSLLLGAGVAAFAMVSWHSSIMCWDEMTESFSRENLGLAAWMFSMWIPLLSAALAVRQLLLLVAGRR
jgi:hypothetical protein